MQSSNVNPKGSSNHGPFETFVRADGTAMWAAATSGIPALAMYLLACLLARTWGGKEAVSIWVEIVEQRRKEILRGIENHDLVSESSRMSMSLDLSRQDLAQWDASARAWLQSADRAKSKEQTQLMPIFKNIHLSFSSGSSTYSRIIDSWKHAMTGLESLLQGEPQEISNRAMLLAYSAWHIYPNLIVLGDVIKNVSFDDPCVNPNGVATLAFQPRSTDSSQGTTWSLALSHLRFYGDPVIAESDTDFSRVTIQQLHVIALGSIYNSWDVPRPKIGSISQCSQWFISLWDHVREATLSADEPSSLKGLGCFPFLAEAARETVSLDAAVRAEALQLLAYGSRRAKRFLVDRFQLVVPFFGLRNPCLLAALSEKDQKERGIAYLREYANSNGLKSGDAFIISRSRSLVSGKSSMREFLPAVPHTFTSRKRDEEGNQLRKMSHIRWLLTGKKNGSTTAAEDLSLETELHRRLRFIQDLGEYGTRIFEPPVKINREDCTWPISSFLTDFEAHIQSVATNQFEGETHGYSLIPASRKCLTRLDFKTDPSIELANPRFRSFSTIGDFELFVKVGTKQALPPENLPILHPSVPFQSYSSRLDPTIVARYMKYSLNPRGEREKLAYTVFKPWWNVEYFEDIAEYFLSSKEWLTSLNCLVLATEIYLQLEGATISLKVADVPLNHSLWPGRHRCPNRSAFRSDYPALKCCGSSSNFRRDEVLSCIVYFESGTLCLEPDFFKETLAIASGNSLFVSSILLSDPFYTAAEHGVRRITGNVGRPGISFMVTPVAPKIRPLGNQYNLVNHAPYDDKRENNFKSTSLHLSFTGWELAVEAKGTKAGTIDQEAHFIESIISVLDSGKWVADLDPLRIYFDEVKRLKPFPECSSLPHDGSTECYSIDSWEEFLDGPEQAGVFRAHGNWAARLAAVSIMCQKGQDQSTILLGPGNLCLGCLTAQYERERLAKRTFPLPSVCID